MTQSEAEIDDKLEALRERWLTEPMIGENGEYYASDFAWLLNYIDVLRADLQRCRDGRVKIAVKDALESLGRERKSDPRQDRPVLPPPPPPITFPPDIVERPGAPYGKGGG